MTAAAFPKPPGIAAILRHLNVDRSLGMLNYSTGYMFCTRQHQPEDGIVSGSNQGQSMDTWATTKPYKDRPDKDRPTGDGLEGGRFVSWFELV